MAIVKKTIRASATAGTGTTYWPDSLGVNDASSDGFNLEVIDEDQLNKVTAVLNALAGAGGSTIDVTVQLYDGTNWCDASGVSGSGAFAQVTSADKNLYLPVSSIAKKIRFKVVVGTATSSAFAIYLFYKGEGGAYSA